MCVATSNLSVLPLLLQVLQHLAIEGDRRLREKAAKASGVLGTGPPLRRWPSHTVYSEHLILAASIFAYFELVGNGLLRDIASPTMFPGLISYDQYRRPPI